MPPPNSNLTLSPREIELLRRWITLGAEWKPHWAFIPPEPTPAPTVKDKSWIKNDIDAYILHRLEREGISPSPQADKQILLRRLSFDLRGVPPSLEELDMFLEDESEDAYEKMVDRFLASASYGERWCWEWLDAARYADTNGFQGDPTRSMWPWRDWVIEAINKNMAYDRFSILQLAGDLFPDAGKDEILPTAFNRNHMYNGEGGRIPEETRVENVMDRVETLGTVWMGLTLMCSRCHDHKFDPISQKEYYQLYDYFNQTSEEGIGYSGRVAPILDLSDSLKIVELEELQKWVNESAAELAILEAKMFPHKKGETPADSPNIDGLSGDHLYALRIPPARRNPYFLRLLTEAFDGKNSVYVKQLQDLSQKIRAKDQQAASHMQVMVMDDIPTKRPSYILTRGSYEMPEEQVSMGVPGVLPAIDRSDKQNRLSLAKWLFSGNHPLTARVTVNRFWQNFFGMGLVKTVEDFGIQGEQPSHPKLLDHLALYFVNSGWDVKSLHKQIVMSATYRQRSRFRKEVHELDPDNRLLARGPRYRLPSWMIRDQALVMSGLLHDSIGGPSVKPYQPAGVWKEATFGFKQYIQDHGSKLYRKTMYSFWRRIVGPTVLFDNSNRQTCSVRGNLTNTPLHALTTLNDITYMEAARVMAERVMLQEQDKKSRLQLAFRLATSRMPIEDEVSILQTRLELWLKSYAKDEKEAEKLVQVGEYRQNEALDVSEQAAYASICLLIMNMDESISKQ